jgi:hypothetical protein
MAMFAGQLQRNNEEPTWAQVQLDDGRLRIVTERRRVGSWAADEVITERVSIFRFNLIVDDTSYAFMPEDPAGFAEAVGVVIDLRENKGRFGLLDRIRQAQAGSA